MRSSALKGPPTSGERGREAADCKVDDVALAAIGTPAARQGCESSRVLLAEWVFLGGCVGQVSRGVAKTTSEAGIKLLDPLGDGGQSSWGRSVESAWR